LQERGLLISRAGAGVFVADVLGSAFSPALIRLFASHDEAVFDYIAFRRDMEGLAAERAARLRIGHRPCGDQRALPADGSRAWQTRRATRRGSMRSFTWRSSRPATTSSCCT
jgi:hypothetical protein